MKTKVCCHHTRNIGLLVLRLSIALVFVYAGWMKLSDIVGTAEAFAGMGFPAATFFAYLVALVEFVGGIAVALGIYTALFAYLLAFVMLVAFFTVHLTQGFNPMMQLVIVLFGATVGLASAGPGKWAIMNDCCNSAHMCKDGKCDKNCMCDCCKK